MPMADSSAYVILPAAGTGQRCGLNPPKQMQLLGNQPLLCRTITAFHQIPWVKKIIIPASEDIFKQVKNHTQNFDKVSIILGSSTRHRSIQCGIKVLEEDCRSDSIVIIHDAVRPFVDQPTIKAVFEAAQQHKAAGVTRPLVSTVIASDEHGFLYQSLDRNLYKASEMPQAFHYVIIKTAYERCDDYDFDYGTECLHLALKYTNTRAKLLEGSDSLWKVTYSKDLYAAEAVLREKASEVHLIDATDVASKLTSYIQKNIPQVAIHQSVTSVKASPDIGCVIFAMDSVREESICSDLSSIPHILTANVGGVIFVLLSDEDESYVKFKRVLQEHSKRFPAIMVIGVVKETDASVESVFKFVSSLISLRNPALSGQVLLAH